MVRFLILLLGMVTPDRPGRRQAAWLQASPAGSPTAAQAADTIPGGPAGRAGWPGQYGPVPPGQPGTGPGPVPPGRGRRRRIPLSVKWTVALVAVGLIFRRAIASVVLAALAAGLHLIGISVHLPSVRFAWPWQTITAGRTTNTDLGPWVLQKIEGISRPALGRANFEFYFTHKVSKNIGPWPCWYASTFYAVGHAAATVNLNPGMAWWAPSAGHYQLQVLSHPAGGKPGQVAVAMVLPRPQLPQSAHDVTIDDIPSRPISTQHSWTYPGLGCGMLLRPQFAESVLYSQAQYIAFAKATHEPQVTGPLISTAESEAVQTVRDNFIQPTVNAFGYRLARFTIRWAAG